MAGPRKSARAIAAIIFVIYMAGLTYFLLFSPFLGRDGSVHIYYIDELPIYGDYNIIPFKVIGLFIANRGIIPAGYFFLNLFGNILCFMPFGFLFPIFTAGKIKFIGTTVLAAICSTIYEILQFCTLSGTGDIDDVILNTIGAMLGYASFALCRACLSNGK